MADYVLVFKKTDSMVNTENNVQPIHKDVVLRCMDLWSNPHEAVLTPYSDQDADKYGLMVFDDFLTSEDVENVYDSLMDGRNLVVRLNNAYDMHHQIDIMKPFRMVFHSRCALTDGSWLVVFRKWVDDMPKTHVIHNINDRNHTYIGTDGPDWYDSDNYYSVLVWQRYASPF